MSEVRRSYIRDANLGPVKLARVERWEGGTLTGLEGIEVAFEESSPDARESRFVYYLKVLVTFFCMIWGIVLLSAGPFFLLHYLNSGYFTPDQWMMAGGMIAGTIGFAVLFVHMLPPHRAAVRVFMSPDTDRVSIYRRGRLAETAQLSEVRGVSIEPHPKLADALSALEMKQDWGNRRQVNIYRQAETIYLMIGAGVTVGKIEVASVMGPHQARETMSMRIRAGIELGWRAATAVREGIAGPPVQETAPAPPQPESPATPPKRQRRGRIA